VTHFVLLILVAIGAFFYFMTPDERARLLKVIVVAFHYVKDTIALQGADGEPFFDALRARTARVIAMPVLVVLSTIVFVRSPVLELFVSIMCVWQIGLILERLVGPLAFTTVYVASSVAAAIVNVSASPGGFGVGASGSIPGLYGMLFVTSIWTMIQGSSLTIPLHVAKRLAEVAAIFVLYKLATTGLWNMPALAAVLCGVVGGIVVALDINERTPQVRRLATAMAAVVAVVTLYTVIALHPPSTETVDIRPEIERVIAFESRTAGLYDKEVERFRRGRITVAALADVIDKTIVPELHAVAGRLRALREVPPEQQPLVASAETFLKLRDESWRLRARALHTSDMRGLRQADSKEQASREALRRLNTMARVRNGAESLDHQPSAL
jgi:membrane associated rhomboid family serine protease